MNSSFLLITAVRGILAPVSLGRGTESEEVGRGAAFSSGEFVTYFSVPLSARTSLRD